MSAFDFPSLPPLFDDMMDGLLDIYIGSDGAGDGGVGVNVDPTLTHSGVPCSIQPMSSSEAQKYGSLVGDTLYVAFIPTVSDAGSDITVKGAGTAWQFHSNGVRYEVISEGVLQGDGLQKVDLKRVGTV